MITQGNSWTRMHSLAQRARLAGARRQRLDVRLSPEESALLADVLEAAIAQTWCSTCVMQISQPPG